MRAVDDLAPLVRRCAAGDGAALRRLYESQAPRLKGLALRITRNAALAEDVLHDVFLEVWRRPDRFDPDRGTVAAWLTTLTRYRALDHLRGRAREIGAGQGPDPIDDGPDALARLVSTSDGRALRRCLDLLAAEQRSLIVRAFVEGNTHADLAHLTGMPLGTVKSTIRRGLASLRKCLGA